VLATGILLCLGRGLLMAVLSTAGNHFDRHLEFCQRVTILKMAAIYILILLIIFEEFGVSHNMFV